MQTGKSQHCAHVADYYADWADRCVQGSTARYLRQFFTSCGRMPVGGASDVVKSFESGLDNAKRAAREWERAGGAA